MFQDLLTIRLGSTVGVRLGEAIVAALCTWGSPREYQYRTTWFIRLPYIPTRNSRSTLFATSIIMPLQSTLDKARFELSFLIKNVA
jgi:hypothetical protein